MKTTRRDPRRYVLPSPPSSKSPVPPKRKSPHPSDLSVSLHGLESLLDSEDHEFSFSREHHLDRLPPAEPVKLGTSSSSNSTNSTREVSEATAKVEKALKSVNSQLSLLESKAPSDSYACTMALKKAKDKLLSLSSLDKLLIEKKTLAEEQEKRLNHRQKELTDLQTRLEERTMELNAREMLIDEYVPRIQMLEMEVAEARKTAQTQKTTVEGGPAGKIDGKAGKSLPKLTEIEGELKRTASLLESRTYELIREERELHRKEAELQAKQAAFMEDQGKFLIVKAEVETNQQILFASKQNVDLQLEKLKKVSLRKESELICSSLLSHIVNSASSTVQARLLSSLEAKKQQTSQLISLLEAELLKTREIQSNFHRETELFVRLQSEMRENEEKLRKKEAILNGELALVKESKIDQLLKRREEAITVKERAFNEKLRKLKELQGEIKQKEESAQLFYEETMRKIAENTDFPTQISVNSMKFESILRAAPETDLKNRELQLDLREKAICDREKLILERENALKDLQRSVEVKQEKMKTLWASLASAANLISRSKEGGEGGRGGEKEEGGELGEGVEVRDFAESFRVRQRQMIEHFADVERERREMSETLKEFLGSDNVAVRW